MIEIKYEICIYDIIKKRNILLFKLLVTILIVFPALVGTVVQAKETAGKINTTKVPEYSYSYFL